VRVRVRENNEKHDFVSQMGIDRKREGTEKLKDKSFPKTQK
jgi:hypothetical protein